MNFIVILMLACLEVVTFTSMGGSIANGDYKSAGFIFGCGVVQVLILNYFINKKPH